MKAVTKLLCSGAALGAFAIAAPASAQGMPGYGYGYGSGDIISTVIGTVLGGGAGAGYGYGSPYGSTSPYGYGSPNGYGSGAPYGYGSPYGSGSPYGYGSPYGNQYGYSNNRMAQDPMSQAAMQQCMGAVQVRLNQSYGTPASYGYGQGGPRVLGVSEIEPRTNGQGLLVRGVANSGRALAYNGGQPPVDLTFKCKTDTRGRIVDVDIEAAAQINGAYGYNQVPVGQQPGQPDYSAYGYRRY